MSEDQAMLHAVPRLERAADRLCDLEDRERSGYELGAMRAAMIFAAGAVVVPAFLAGIWIICWLIVRAPL